MKYLVAFLIAPVTGPLTVGMLDYWNAGRWGMALVCAAGIAEFWTFGTAFVAWSVSLA